MASQQHFEDTDEPSQGSKNGGAVWQWFLGPLVPINLASEVRLKGRGARKPNSFFLEFCRS